MTFPPTAVPNTSQTTYMQGTRRIDEMAWNARQLAYQENYSFTEGWNDNTVAEIFNLALNEIYDAITQVDEVANIDEYVTTVYATVQSYPIPQVMKTASQIMNVRFLYGPETWQFITLEQGMIQDRFSYPTNIPSTYCIRNGYILLSPTPNITRENSLIINYQKRMRSLDYRRGRITYTSSPLGIITSYGNVSAISNANPCQITTATNHGLTTGDKVGIGGIFEPNALIDQTFIITVTGLTTFTLNGFDSTLLGTYTGQAVWYENPVQFQLDFTVTSQKDTNMQANANSKLNYIDWVCLVDRNGVPVIDAIPVNNYNQTTQILTAESDYVIPYANWQAFLAIIAFQDPCYFVVGDYASTHSELDRTVEDLLIEYVVLRLLRLQSAAEPTDYQLQAERAVLERVRIAYRRYRPSILPIMWQRRNLRTGLNAMGGKGYY